MRQMRFQVVQEIGPAIGYPHSNFATERGAANAARRLSAGNGGRWFVRDVARRVYVQAWQHGTRSM